MSNIFKTGIAVVAVMLSQTLSAKVTMSGIFSDNMVLQRGKTIVLWGNADKGESVKLSLKDENRTAKADKSGKWRVELPAMKHGGPYEIVVTGKSDTLRFENVMIGDVWLCSGQSNMEFELNGDSNAKSEISKANHPNIRLFTVPKNIQTRPQSGVDSKWEVCSPETAEKFSAVGYFFGKRLNENLDVAIGLIDSSWGGTDIETWTSWDASMANDQYSKYRGQSMEKALGFTMEDIERFKKAMTNEDDVKAGFANSNKGWVETVAPQVWSGKLENEDGIVWFKKEFTLPNDFTTQDAELNIGAIDDEDITFINGVEVGRMAFWIANRNYKVKSGILKPGRNVITVRVKDTGAIGGMIGQNDQLWLQVGGTKYPLSGAWAYKPYVLSSSFGFKSYGYSPNSFASLLYNGMISPIVGYPLKGVIWYQGENNSGQAYKYRQLFPNLINDWRAKWNDEFPFLWVQLASFMMLDKDPAVQSDWAELREAQSMTLSLPKTGQAVITDIGEAFDIHPRNKHDVGYRLAHTAMNVAYDMTDSLAGGPEFDAMEVKHGKAVLSFKNKGAGLSTSDNNKYGYVYGFAIAGEDRKFEWAKAFLLGDKVIVFSENVKNPVAVRYGWSNNPIEINLVNGQGLLASPFRSDDWMDPRKGR